MNWVSVWVMSKQKYAFKTPHTTGTGLLHSFISFWEGVQAPFLSYTPLISTILVVLNFSLCLNTEQKLHSPGCCSPVLHILPNEKTSEGSSMVSFTVFVFVEGVLLCLICVPFQPLQLVLLFVSMELDWN